MHPLACSEEMMEELCSGVCVCVHMCMHVCGVGMIIVSVFAFLFLAERVW